MITVADIEEAIAECQGVRNPNASVCIKLAAFYTILDHLQEEHPARLPIASYDPPPPEDDGVYFESETEFGKMVQGKKGEDVWPVIDELMSTLRVMQPRLYEAVLRRL